MNKLEIDHYIYLVKKTQKIHPDEKLLIFKSVTQAQHYANQLSAPGIVYNVEAMPVYNFKVRYNTE